LRLIVAAAVVATMLVGGCRRASVSEVGEANRASAFPMAEMRATQRAADVSPDSVSEAAKGTPMREAPVAGVPQQAVSHPQP